MEIFLKTSYISEENFERTKIKENHSEKMLAPCFLAPSLKKVIMLQERTCKA